jgi:hypothetical protein
MPAIARITTFGKNIWRDRDRLVECLRNGEPFYMASTTGGPITPDMNPSMGRANPDASLIQAILNGEIDYMIWSYETPIAWRYRGEWAQNREKYSPTTTQHQHIIATAISQLEAN